MGENILTTIQEDMTARLAADEYLASVTVLNADRQEIASEIAMALSTVTPRGGKIGAAVIVTQPTAEDANANALFGPLDVLPSVLILENPTFNRDSDNGTQKKAHWIARRVSRVLKLASADGMHTPLIPRRPHIVATGFDDPDLQKLAPVAYEVNFQCRELDPTAYSKVEQPVITTNAGLITITCATAGATIYYTFDASFPWSGAVGVEQYSVPFGASSTLIIRAAAYKADMIGSDVARFVVP